MMGYFILILHAFLVFGIVMFLIFFNAVISYFLWIFLGCAALSIGLGYIYHRRLKSRGKGIGDILRSPTLRGRTVEISFMNGLAAVRLGRPDSSTNNELPRPPELLEDPDTMKIREISELARLLENDLISQDEYNRLKKHLFKTITSLEQPRNKKQKI